MSVIETLPGYAVGTWKLDVPHTDIGFSVRHLMVSKVRGTFTRFSGTITTAEDPMDSSAEVTVDLSSIDTRDADRDAHLRSTDFFDAENNPTMTYKSRSLRLDGDDLVAVGDLTIKGVTRPVELTVEYQGTAQDPWGGTRLGLSARGEINRSDFGIAFNVPLEGGGVMVGDRIRLRIEVEAVLES